MIVIKGAGEKKLKIFKRKRHSFYTTGITSTKLSPETIV